MVNHVICFPLKRLLIFACTSVTQSSSHSELNKPIFNMYFETKNSELDISGLSLGSNSEFWKPAFWKKPQKTATQTNHQHNTRNTNRTPATKKHQQNTNTLQVDTQEAFCHVKGQTQRSMCGSEPEPESKEAIIKKRQHQRAWLSGKGQNKSKRIEVIHRKFHFNTTKHKAAKCLSNHYLKEWLAQEDGGALTTKGALKDFTNQEVLCDPHGEDINRMTDGITEYIKFCEHTSLPARTVRSSLTTCPGSPVTWKLSSTRRWRPSSQEIWKKWGRYNTTRKQSWGGPRTPTGVSLQKTVGETPPS